MCAVAYVLLLERLDRQVQAMTVACGVAAALGRDGVTFPDPDGARADFDRDLAAEPAAAADDSKTVMLRALGLR